MFSFRKFAPTALAALLMTTVPLSALAAEGKAQAPQEQVKEQAKDQVKEQPKEQTTPQAKPESKGSPSDVLARVNGTAITRQEVNRAVKVLLAQSQVPEPVDPELLKQVEDAALEQLISAELLYQEALKLEIKDLDKQVTEKVAQNKAKFKSEEEFSKALNAVDMTAKDMNDFTRKDILINTLIEQRFSSKAEVSDAEARKFYNDNLEKYFSKPETVGASHILIGASESATPEERKKAKEKAEEIAKRLKAGADFAATAKAESSCPSSAQGGDLGKFTRGQMVPPFEKAAFALKTGEMSDVVETQFGYHIIKVTSHEDASTEKFDDVKAKIVEFLKREKIQKGITDNVEKLRKEAKIEKP
jgi:peptidyl-prolyl cis-trans isomerase C